MEAKNTLSKKMKELNQLLHQADVEDRHCQRHSEDRQRHQHRQRDRHLLRDSGQYSLSSR